MSARRILEVALRIMGLWLLFAGMAGLSKFGTIWLTDWMITKEHIVSYSVAVVWQLLLGAALLGWAPRIAMRFYPPESDSGELIVAVGPGDMYRIACFVFGVYLLLQTAVPIGRLLNGAVLTARGYTPPSGPLASDAVTVMMHGLAGILLIFGSQRIAKWFSNLHYDPDTIPDQRVSIMALMLMFVLAAVVLGTIRAISLNGS